MGTVQSQAVGFVGLGNMGLPMAERLLGAGFRVRGFDISAARVGAFEAAGGEPVLDLSNVVLGASHVVTMLPKDEQVIETMDGPGGLFVEAAKGSRSVFIDMSSVLPRTSRMLARDAEALGLAFLDAPVSRGQQAARTGTLITMVGGSYEAFERSKPVLEAMASDVVWMGESGAGSLSKVANNLIVGAVIAATAESLALGALSGLDVKKLASLLGQASANSFVLEHFYPRALAGDFSPGFYLDLMEKDLGLAVETGRDCGLPLFVGGATQQLYRLCSALGFGMEDATAVFHVLADRPIGNAPEVVATEESSADVTI